MLHNYKSVLSIGFILILAAAFLTLACSVRGPSQQVDRDEVAAPESVRVARVIDGDTVVLANGELVRYLGIDTPETVHPDKPIECFGPEATERNRQLVEGKTVELWSDGPDKDSYDRLLRYVFTDGTFVNGVLVWEGYAFARSYGDSLRLYQTLVQLERSAREGGRGLWETCNK